MLVRKSLKLDNVTSQESEMTFLITDRS